MARVIAVALVLIAGLGFVVLVARAPVPPKKTTPVAIDPARMIAKQLPLEERLRAEALPPELEAMRSIAVAKIAPEEGDWLWEHEESGQSIAQHRVDCRPVPERVVYLVPVGEFGPNAAKVLDRLEPLLAAHFQLPVKRLPALGAAEAGKSEREGQLGKQWLTQDILAALLKVRPSDAAAVMGVTEIDLYPDPQWNFVFGEASYEDRVGVMSLARTGDMEIEPTTVLTRAYQTGMHEIGHMLQILHCIAWECPMNGCNHQQESDTRPLEPCPHCLAKLMRATGLDPRKRWAAMREAYSAAGMSRGVREIDALLAVDAGH